MIKVLFVCLGNICRSPMAEYIFKDLVRKKGFSDKFVIASAGTSSEEVGNRVHPGTMRILKGLGIDASQKRAIQLRKEDYDRYDYIIGMEQSNIRSMERIFKGDSQKKIMRLLDFSPRPRDIADPWYTGNFDKTFEDVMEGCQVLLDYICKREGIVQD
ncbi:MAG: protein-tyrosine-phosphatase [Lachnoclostridium sp.]|jgi:protein-tyrosine phosphatase